MSAMEKMLMNMLGVDATGLNQMASNLSGMIKKIADNMEAINATQVIVIDKLDELSSKLERLENGNSNSDGNASAGSAGNG